MRYIPEDSLPNLHKYKYGGVDKSLVSRYVLSRYWNGLVKLFPLWIAPNMITLIGLLCVMLNVATLYYYAPDLGPCPKWVHTSFGIGLFIYQSLDAIDGKQARRTGQSGPLGELFDHGCDALNTTLGVLTWSSSAHLGQSWWTVVSLIASLGNFYMSTWEEFHTGQLYLGYFSGPVEGVLMLVGVHLISGYFGPEIWTLRIAEVFPLTDWSNKPSKRIIGGLQLNHALIIIGAAVLLFNIVTAIKNVVVVKYRPTEFSYNDRSILKALADLLPFVYFVLVTVIWLKLWPTVVTDHLPIFIPHLGLLFGHQVGLMITAHVAKLQFPKDNFQFLLVLTAGCLIAYLDVTTDGALAISKPRILISLLTVSTFLYAGLARGVINEICTYLNKHCLRV